jgi:phosphoribosylanthranilate isomerase
MTRIKFCGLTREADLETAVDLGIDAVGFVFWARSPRALSANEAAGLVRRLPESVTPVGVFVQPTRDEIAGAVEIAGIRVAQLHAMTDSSPVAGLCELWVAATLQSSPLNVPEDTTILLDAPDDERHGGTGRQIDWDAARHVTATRRVILAGGLTPRNVAEAIRRAQPYGVDVSSGIEERPGVKNATLMKDFVAAVRRAGLQPRHDAND